MAKINKFLLALAVAGAFTGMVCKTSASLIDLGERDLATRLTGQNQALAFIESDQGLATGSLTYLNNFDQDTGFANNGAVDSSHFNVSLINGGTSAMTSWNLNTAGFALSYVFVKDGRGSTSGPYLYHIYGVTPDERFNSLIAQLVTINNSRQLQQVGFYGVVGSPCGGRWWRDLAPPRWGALCD